MQNVGVIAEFNPLHSGHKLLLDTARSFGGSVICVLSSNFVQRGDTSIIPKHARAKSAIACGADVVIELPVPYSMSTAQSFAFGGVSLLESTHTVDKLLFGSECGDINSIYAVCDVFESDVFNKKLAQSLGGNATFAKIRSEILKETAPHLCAIAENPNDTLATEYISSLRRLKSKIKPDCITRRGAAHDSTDIRDLTASASLLREYIKSGNTDICSRYMPEKSFEILKSSPISDISRLDTAILYSLRCKANDGTLARYTDSGEGLENRFENAVKSASSAEELYALIKTKRYTMARIRRLVLSAFLDIDISVCKQKPPYIHILGFSKKGEETVRQIAKKSDIPVITTAADAKKLDGFAKRVFDTECKCSDIYDLSLNLPNGCGSEYKQKIIKGDF